MLALRTNGLNVTGCSIQCKLLRIDK